MRVERGFAKENEGKLFSEITQGQVFTLEPPNLRGCSSQFLMKIENVTTLPMLGTPKAANAVDISSGRVQFVFTNTYAGTVVYPLEVVCKTQE